MTSTIKTYRDLEVWKQSMELTVQVYDLTQKLPPHEQFGLISQMRRAAVSIPSNIAEGHSRRGKKELSHQASIAKGSLAELETQMILCTRLKYIDREALVPIWDQAQQVGKLLSGLLKSLR